MTNGRRVTKRNEGGRVNKSTRRCKDITKHQKVIFRCERQRNHNGKHMYSRLAWDDEGNQSIGDRDG